MGYEFNLVGSPPTKIQSFLPISFESINFTEL